MNKRAKLGRIWVYTLALFFLFIKPLRYCFKLMVAYQDGIKRLLGGEEKPCTPLLMATLDALNVRFGRGTVRLGSAALVNGQAQWQSSAFTARLKELRWLTKLPTGPCAPR